MIHFRLRRLFRLRVNLLPLNFAGSSGSFRVPRVLFREPQAIAPSTFPSLHPLPPSYPLTPEIGSPKRQDHARRYVASGGLLLALSLEICGCNPSPGLGLVLQDMADATARGSVAPSEQELFFYDPSDRAGSTAASPVTTDDPSADPPLIPPPNPADAKPLPWAIPESVYLVYKDPNPSGPQNLSRPHPLPIAAAFVLSVPDISHHHHMRFLITARHVVDPQWAHCSQENPSSIDLRLNRRNGGVGYETVPLQSGSIRLFYTPSDPTADLAVIPLDRSLNANLDDYKFLDVPFSLLPTDAEIRFIRTDQQIMTAGLSARSPGRSGSYPVFSPGFLSKMPTETVGVRCGSTLGQQSSATPLHVWFVSAGVSQGVSGAPVYTSAIRGSGEAKTPVLLGIQSVAWPDKGIAAITPSRVLGDLIQSSLRGSKLKLDFYRGPSL